MPFFRVLLSPTFAGAGYQKKAIFSGAGCQNMSKRSNDNLAMDYSNIIRSINNHRICHKLALDVSQYLGIV